MNWLKRKWVELIDGWTTWDVPPPPRYESPNDRPTPSPCPDKPSKVPMPPVAQPRSKRREHCPKCGSKHNDIEYHVGSHSQAMGDRPGPRCKIDQCSSDEDEHLHATCVCGYDWIQPVIMNGNHVLQYMNTIQAEQDKTKG